MRSEVVLTNFKVFGNVMNTFSSVDTSSQSKLQLRRKRRKKKYMLIKITHPNHRDGSDFLCFNLLITNEFKKNFLKMFSFPFVSLTQFNLER